MIFLSGCSFRCSYCHNPDTWYTNGKKTSSEEVIAKIARNKRYYKNGGVTISGGEPLLQGEFVCELLKGFKKENLHTALDTSACVLPSNIDEILKFVDLIILDLKFPTEELYVKYCKGSITNVLKLIKLANKYDKKVLLRTVIVPDINDSRKMLDQYLEIAKTVRNCKYELLGYHTLGVDKYKKLGLKYELADVKAMDGDKLIELQKYIDKEMKADEQG